MRKKLIIIGAGPAGITASIYAKRAGMDFILLEKYIPGGNLVNAYEIENYPGFAKISGAELAMNMQNQLSYLNIDTVYDQAIEITKKDNGFILKTLNGSTYETENIILALGTKPKTLELENEDKYLGKGISYCATCDGAFYKEKEVLVVGGGNSAVSEATFLAAIVKKVTIISRHRLRADKKDIDKLLSFKNVEVIENQKVDKLIGKEKIEKVILKSTIDESINELKVDGIFIYIGQIPPTAWLSKLNILNKYGFILTNDKFETQINGLYAIGDCIEKELRQIVTAQADAAIVIENIKNK